MSNVKSTLKVKAKTCMKPISNEIKKQNRMFRFLKLKILYLWPRNQLPWKK